MKQRTLKYFILSLTLLIFQGCYTMVSPPETLPDTVTQVISGPVYASSVGSPGLYGWDPYWEPTLPYTSYYTGFGASYYNPYNYYDYHHSYYEPVYYGHGGGAAPEPVAGRGFDRDDELGGGRDRQPNSGTTSVPGSGQDNKTPVSGMSTAAPAIPQPVITQPAPVKNINPQTVRGSRRTRDVTPSPSGKIGSTKQVRDSTKSTKTSESSESTPKKRTRTRK